MKKGQNTTLTRSLLVSLQWWVGCWRWLTFPRAFPVRRPRSSSTSSRSAVPRSSGWRTLSVPGAPAAGAGGTAATPLTCTPSWPCSPTPWRPRAPPSNSTTAAGVCLNCAPPKRTMTCACWRERAHSESGERERPQDGEEVEDHVKGKRSSWCSLGIFFIILYH